ncbi:MAG: PadR family transcriptional regulator [Bacteroidales bacterium]|nr:PadR family transcriptional regulator [Bacteroidales bacterium]MCF8334194.1 PadR family transcriptional regulator [Bacteroidales bacterium]
MKAEKTKAQMRKGVLELCILSIIGQQDAYASDIIQHLKSADLIVVEGTLYPLLTRLKNAGLLEYHWQESKSGPPRKYYRLNEEGQAMLETLKEDWYNLQNQVNQLLESKKQNQ